MAAKLFEKPTVVGSTPALELYDEPSHRVRL
jgi:hypothetical protein